MTRRYPRRWSVASARNSPSIYPRANSLPPSSCRLLPREVCLVWPVRLCRHGPKSTFPCSRGDGRSGFLPAMNWPPPTNAGRPRRLRPFLEPAALWTAGSSGVADGVLSAAASRLVRSAHLARGSRDAQRRAFQPGVGRYRRPACRRSAAATLGPAVRTSGRFARRVGLRHSGRHRIARADRLACRLHRAQAMEAELGSSAAKRSSIGPSYSCSTTISSSS